MRLLACLVAVWLVSQATAGRPDIPVAWDDAALERMSMTLAGLGLRPTHAPAEYYRQIPLSRIPRTYPVYAPGREAARGAAIAVDRANRERRAAGGRTIRGLRPSR